MSGNLFNNSSVGLYCFDLQTIEIDNEALGLSDEDAREVIKTTDLYSLSGKELKFYQTYLHEFIHYFDGTASLWGLEFCGRLYRYYETGDDNQFNVLALNASEVFLHDKFLPSGEKLTFANLTVGIDYDEEQGVHSVVHYEYNKNPVYSAPLSLLSVLEGHAYSQEKLFTWRVYTAQNDLVLQRELMREVEMLLKDPDCFEYTCILSMVYQSFPNLEFSQKLEIVIGVCSLALNVTATRMSATPEWLIVTAFPHQANELQSAIHMDFMRGMNRASYAFIILVLFDIRQKNINLDSNVTIFKQLEEVLDECVPEPFGDYGLKIESEVAMEGLEKIQASLVLHSAMQLQGKSRYEFDLRSIELPEVMLSSLEFAEAANPFVYSISEHYDKYSDRKVRLDRKRKGCEFDKEHLRPEEYHQWLESIKTGK